MSGDILLADKYWVIIETGSNQRYIFGTNKRRANIGASELVHRVGTQWVKDALPSDGVTPVVLASGKAILIADTREQGKKVITSVATKALRDAPGLGVWGVVRAITSDGDRGLRAAHEALARVRAEGAPPELRFPTMPFTQPCAHTGLPAATTGSAGDGNEQAWSAQFDAVFRVKPSEEDSPSKAGIKRLRRIVKTGRDGKGGTPVPILENAVPTNLDPAGKKKAAADEKGDAEIVTSDLGPVQNKGWIAIVHADGNGIGNLFLNIGAKFGDADLRRTLEDFSSELNGVTCKAVSAAAEKAAENYKEAHRRDPKAWILPVIVGGDDVTVILDARMALDFTEAFLAAFERLARVEPTIAKVNQAIHGLNPPPVTASAGIAFIKPHHPFSDGYDLAEQLCSSAKVLTKARGNRSALDYHVLFDAVGRDVGAIRETGVVASSEPGSTLRLWSGPVLRDAEPSIGTLRTAVKTFGKASTTVSSAQAHAVRSALVVGGQRIADTLDQRGLKRPSRELVEAEDSTNRADKMSWVLDALALDEVARGTSR